MTIPEFVQEIARDARALYKYYTYEELFKSFLTGFLYFLLPSVLIIALGVNLIITFYYIFMWYYVIMFLILFILVYYGICKVIETLKNYNDVAIIRYTRIKITMVVPAFLFVLYIAIGVVFEIT